MKIMKLLVLALALSCVAGAQYPYPYPQRRVPATTSGKPKDSVNGMVVTFHGKLVEISKKEVTIETEDQPVFNIGRTGKTKFLKDGKPIKPESIPAGTMLTVDVTKDPDLNPLALTVLVDDAPAKPKAQ
jgi:hypothetical protein